MLGWFWRDPPWVNHDSLAITRGLIHSGHSVMGLGGDGIRFDRPDQFDHQFDQFGRMVMNQQSAVMARSVMHSGEG
jgi:hypothetical protein